MFKRGEDPYKSLAVGRFKRGDKLKPKYHLLHTPGRFPTDPYVLPNFKIMNNKTDGLVTFDKDKIYQVYDAFPNCRYYDYGVSELNTIFCFYVTEELLREYFIHC